MRFHRTTIAICILLGTALAPMAAAGEEPDETARQLVDAALAENQAWDKLAWLTDRIGHRLGGSEQLERAVAWAVERAALAVGGTCLPKAFVGEWLLRRRGQSVDMRVGVAKDASGGLDAHAWLEVEGETIIGAVEEMGRFSTFPSLQAPPHRR